MRSGFRFIFLMHGSPGHSKRCSHEEAAGFEQMEGTEERRISEMKVRGGCHRYASPNEPLTKCSLTKHSSLLCDNTSGKGNQDTGCSSQAVYETKRCILSSKLSSLMFPICQNHTLEFGLWMLNYRFKCIKLFVIFALFWFLVDVWYLLSCLFLK